MSYLDLLKEQFNHHVAFRERRPGVLQLLAPLYHEDGDMMEIFLEPKNGTQERVRICDHGMTLMRLSYAFDLDTPNKERIFQKILAENHVAEENGNLFVETKPESLYPAVLQFAQTVAKVSNMQLYKREVIQSLFYELLAEFIEESLVKYRPRPGALPIPSRDDLEVDFEFDIKPRPIYLFAVRDTAKARLAAISCLEFQRAKLPFKSFVVHEDFEALTKKDRSRITSAGDKQFVSLDDFKKNAEQVLEREAA
ncbi:MAG: DUF1828 domain-containing protein [Deltaproteobacteria bacterium]|nr:DUF1828 domain-containing protein [Deltaproteobacteria bacterium]MBI3388074.1 DUF1828 domain-containing protein [Deltaproteobacteria bacterium]